MSGNLEHQVADQDIRQCVNREQIRTNGTCSRCAPHRYPTAPIGHIVDEALTNWKIWRSFGRRNIGDELRHDGIDAEG
jgi:hypothetical protein